MRGAVCTAPVPASSVTCSPRMSGTCLASQGCSSFSPSSCAPRQRPDLPALESKARQRSRRQLRRQHQHFRSTGPLHPHERRIRIRRVARPPRWRAASRAWSSNDGRHARAAERRRIQPLRRAKSARSTSERPRQWRWRCDSVFDLRFGQRRTAIEAPVHRPEPTVQMTVGDDLAERAYLLRLRRCSRL